MKNATFEWIMVAVMSIVLICVVVYSIDAHMDRMEAKAEANSVTYIDHCIEEVNEINDELFAFIMSDEYQEWVTAYGEGY